MRTLMLALLAVAPCFADDILMKDGRVLSWKSISEEGDSYTLVAKDGAVTRVKKADVEKFVIPREGTAPGAGPLTGATFLLGKKVQTTNLVPKADLDHAVTGNSWKMVGMALVGEAIAPAWTTLPFDFDVPADDYDLTLTVERLSGSKTFAVGVGTPAGECAYHFDAYDSTVSCLTVLAGQEGEHAKGQVFKKGVPKTIKLSIRKDALMIQVDGKELWKGRVPWGSAAVHQNIASIARGKLFVAAEGGSWKVHSFTVTK
jgi:hypothetical protein